MIEEEKGIVRCISCLKPLRAVDSCDMGPDLWECDELICPRYGLVSVAYNVLSELDRKEENEKIR